MSYKYTGPVSGKGLFLKGIIWEKPWDWKPEEIEANLKKDKSLEKYFSKQDKEDEKAIKSTSNSDTTSLSNAGTSGSSSQAKNR